MRWAFSENLCVPPALRSARLVQRTSRGDLMCRCATHERKRVFTNPTHIPVSLLFLLKNFNIDLLRPRHIIRQNRIGKFLELICQVTDIKLILGRL